MRVGTPQPHAFVVEHWDAPLLHRGASKTSNLFPNGDFEDGYIGSEFNVHNYWNIVSGTTPPPHETYAMQADSGQVADGRTPVKAVTGSSKYLFRFALGQAEHTGGGDPLPNTLTVEARWYDALLYGNLVRTDTLYQGVVDGNDEHLKAIKRRVTAPSNAVGLILSFRNVHLGGAAGTPGGTIVDDIMVTSETFTDDNVLMETLRHVSLAPQQGFKNLVYATNHMTGFKAVEFDLTAPAPLLLQWIDDAVGHELVVRHATGREVWRGVIWKMSGNFAGVPYVASYEDVYSRYVVPWGSKGKEIVLTVDALAQRYGDKIFLDSNAHTNQRDAVRTAKSLAQQFALPVFGEHLGAFAGAQTFTLHVVGIGMFSTLDFIRGIKVPGQSDMDMHQAIATHASSLLNAARARGNVFISADYALVTDVGQKVGTTDKHSSSNESIMDTVLKYLAEGAGDGKALVSGVWENNRFVLRKRSNEIVYYTDASGEAWRDGSGAAINKAFVQAGNFYRAALPIPRVLRGAATTRADGRFITETKYNTETDELNLSSVGAKSVDKRIAKGARLLWRIQRGG